MPSAEDTDLDEDRDRGNPPAVEAPDPMAAGGDTPQILAITKMSESTLGNNLSRSYAKLVSSPVPTYDYLLLTRDLS